VIGVARFPDVDWLETAGCSTPQCRRIVSKQLRGCHLSSACQCKVNFLRVLELQCLDVTACMMVIEKVLVAEDRGFFVDAVDACHKPHTPTTLLSSCNSCVLPALIQTSFR
jgi:hypothetical protein